MLEKLLYRFRVGHAYWRTAPFAEVAELYASRFLCVVAQNLIGSFIVVILYQHGYGLASIFGLLTGYFLYRGTISLPLAHVIAWIGPKTAILLSNALAIPALVALSFIGDHLSASVLLYFAFEGVSSALLTIATDVQFSSIKTSHKAGREISWLTVTEKIAAAVAPVVGGFLAFRFGPQSIMWLSAFMMLAAALPLFFSPEHLRRKQRVTYAGFPWKRAAVQVVTPALRGYVTTAGSSVWSLYIALFVVGMSSDAVYAELGIFFSISFLASVVVSRTYGVLIDRRKGIDLLRAGVVLSTLTQAVRPLVSTQLAVGMVNASSEVANSAYGMPILRAQYDMVDNLPGYRVVYLALTMFFLSVGAAAATFAAFVFVSLLGDIDGLRAMFTTAAFISPLIFVHGFDSLRRRR